MEELNDGLNVFELFGTDAEMEKKGIWLDYGSFRILIARAGGANAKYSRVLEALTKPYRRAIELGTFPEAKAQSILKVVYARAIVLAWEGEGLVDLEGNPLEYSEENVIWLFEKAPDLFADVQKQSVKMELFRQVEREGDAKN